MSAQKRSFLRREGVVHSEKELSAQRRSFPCREGVVRAKKEFSMQGRGFSPRAGVFHAGKVLSMQRRSFPCREVGGCPTVVFAEMWVLVIKSAYGMYVGTVIAHEREYVGSRLWI